MGEIKYVYRVPVGKSLELLVGLQRKWEENIKTDLREMSCEELEGNELA
jgi:hypothetical protein